MSLVKLYVKYEGMRQRKWETVSLNEIVCDLHVFMTPKQRARAYKLLEKKVK